RQPQGRRLHCHRLLQFVSCQYAVFWNFGGYIQVPPSSLQKESEKDVFLMSCNEQKQLYTLLLTHIFPYVHGYTEHLPDRNRLRENRPGRACYFPLPPVCK